MSKNKSIVKQKISWQAFKKVCLLTKEDGDRNLWIQLQHSMAIVVKVSLDFKKNTFFYKVVHMFIY